MGTDTSSSPLYPLANILETRRQSARPMSLLLSSRFTFPPSVLKRVCGSERWDHFRRALSNQPTGDKLVQLGSALDQEDQRAAYQVLARLMCSGYFRTVLTTGLDATLENFLLDLGVRGSDLRVLIVDRESPEQIARTLDDRGGELLLLKLHGSLHEQALPEQFPNLLELSVPLRESLKRYFKQSLLVVGSVDQDDDLRNMFAFMGTDGLYYVPSATDAGADNDDFLLRMMEAKYDARQRVLFAQPGNDFTSFFTDLQACLASLLPSSGQAEPREEAAARPRAAPVFSTPAERADVLLVTATEVEATALHNCYGRTPPVKVIGSQSYFHLGAIGGASVWHVQTEMGSNGPAGSRTTIAEGIQSLAPRAVILLGIAGGAQPGGQAVGDILVSQRLMIYHNLRIGTNLETQALDMRARGERVMASARLLNRFRSGWRAVQFAAWERFPPPQVIFGLLLSGDFLIDHQPFLDQLIQLEPDTIGYEMEAAGLYYAASPFGTDWIVVKAISDFGNGSKNVHKRANQSLAACNAARFVLEILAQGGF